MVKKDNGNGHTHVEMASLPPQPTERIRIANGAPLPQEQFEAGLQSIVQNAIMERTSLLTRMMDTRRNLENDCGYPQPNEVGPEYYKTLYEREPVAARVVELMPKESWQVSPMVYEDEDSENVTDFEEAWDNLSKELRGGESWFQDEEGSPIWEYLYRADKLSGIGGFGVLLLGFDDGRNLYEPLDGIVSLKPTGNSRDEERLSLLQASIPYITKSEVDFCQQEKLTINGIATPKELMEEELYKTMGTEAMYSGVQLGPSQYPAKGVSKKERKLMFMRPYDESLVQVVQYEANIRNPRFGQPIMYRITLNDSRDYRGGIGLSMSTVQVHWSRVIHLADNRNASEVFGAPRLRPVLNAVLDIRKVRGGSAEMYWKGAFPGISLSTHPQLGGDVPVDEASIKNMMENYFSTLQRFMLNVGMSATTLSPTVVDPTGQINVQMQAICVQLGVPERVFMGSERGELASSQDDAAWNDRLRHRQNMYLTPFVIVPFVDRLIKAGVLPEPKFEKSAKKIDDAKKAGKKVEPMDTFPAKKDTTDTQAKPSFAAPSKNHSPNYLVIRNAETGKIEGVVTKGGYSVEWPELDSLGEKDKAMIAAQYTTALAAYQAGGVQDLIEPKSYFTQVFEWDDERAQGVLDATEKHVQETLDDNLALADEHDMQVTPPPGLENKPPPPPPMVGAPGGPPAVPVKLGGGQNLVHPQTGATVAKGPPMPKPARNIENDADWIIDSPVYNENPNHDEMGRFAEGDGGSSVAGQLEASREKIRELIPKDDKGNMNPSAGEYPHMAHLLTGSKVHSSGHTKAEAKVQAMEMRSRGIYASGIKDTNTGKYLLTVPANNVEYDEVETVVENQVTDEQMYDDIRSMFREAGL